MNESFLSLSSRLEPTSLLSINGANCISSKSFYKPAQIAQNFNLKVLNNVYLNKVEELQRVVILDLQKRNQTNFLYERKTQDFINIFESHNSFIFGCFIGEELVGQVIVSELHKYDMIEGKDYNINSNMKEKLCMGDDFKFFSIGGTIIHPNFRGKNLAKLLISQTEDVLNKKFSQEKIALLSIASSDNPGSYSSFCSSGFYIISNFISQEDGDNDYLMCKLLTSKGKAVISSINAEFHDSPKPLISKIGNEVICKNEKGFFAVHTKYVANTISKNHGIC